MIRIILKLNEIVVFRFFIAGGTSAAVDLAVLYLLNIILGIHYLLSATLAFIVAFGISFTLHKFWTFRKTSKEKVPGQIVLYLGTSLIGLAFNTIGMYVFVDYFHIHVIVSQIIVGLLVACCTFFLSRNLVFKYKSSSV